MELERQKSRYYPGKNDHYFDQNITISEYLDSYKPKLAGKKILDIGAGEIPFRDFYSGLNVETCDIQNNSSQTINYIIQPNQALPFADKSYDVIFLFDVLEHVQKDTFFLDECNRILTDGGVMIATIPFMYRFHEIPYDYRRYTPSGLRHIFETAGFKNMEIKNAGSNMFAAKVLLTENQVIVKSYFRKIILRIILYLVKLITIRTEISEVSPFSFFVAAQK